LARLRLSDEDVERMAGELSGVLAHVDRIGELDLDGVEPTTHVVSLENVLRPDEPRPSWPKEAMLDRAPDPADGAFRVPSPQADAQ
jgi:aspartyl-tRNA(Asn)/glutamyl-tRNA(Gln) amidotransferase subunit C